MEDDGGEEGISEAVHKQMAAKCKELSKKRCATDREFFCSCGEGRVVTDLSTNRPT